MADKRLRNRAGRKPPELKAASNSVAYEVETFWCALVLLAQRYGAEEPKEYEEKCEYNALLESFLVHARNLIDFLYLPRGERELRKDDLVASDFFKSEKEWRDAVGPITPFLEEQRTPINKWLSHLTYKRTSKPKRSWNVGRIAAEIVIVLTAFAEAVPAERIDDRLHQVVAQANGDGLGVALRPNPGATYFYANSDQDDA